MPQDFGDPQPGLEVGRGIITIEPPIDREPWLPMPMNVGAITARVKAIDDIVAQLFTEGEHFGVPFGDPNDKKAKRCLLKPGVDVLCTAFAFRPDYIALPGNEESDTFIKLSYRCELVHIPSGRIISTGIGSCNSKEEKYRWKPGSGKPICPECGVDQVWKSRQDPGFFCWPKKGGCGANFREDDKRIVEQKTTREPNDNAFDLLNTIQKMAQKRACMAAIIPACGLSNRFSGGGDEDKDAGQQEAARGRQEPPWEDRRPNPPPSQDPPPQGAQRAQAAPGIDPRHAVDPAIVQEVRNRARACGAIAAFTLLKKELQGQGFPWWSEATKEALEAEYQRRWGQRKAQNPA